MKILAVSDQVIERAYPLASQGHFRGVSMILACGDLPYTYLESLRDHQHYLAQEEGQPLQPPEEAARDYIDEVDS